MNTIDLLSHIINEKLNTLGYRRNPENLYLPIEYVLSFGGKRLRPMLTLIACEMFGGNIEDAMNVALGIEMYHNHTLLHDDVMDKADVRRGQPTVHRKWGENSAILSGDAMLILAYRYVQRTKSNLDKVLELFTETTLQICEGQQFDMEFESRDDVSVDEYMEMIRLKTAVLLACSLKTGALVAGASDKDADSIYEYGIQIGLAFQLQDDILDVYGDEKVFGKKIGGDIICDKKTFLLLTALKKSSSDEIEEFNKWIGNGDAVPCDKIKAVTALYDKLEVRKDAENLMAQCYKKAMDCLENINVPSEKKTILLSLTEKLIGRSV